MIDTEKNEGRKTRMEEWRSGFDDVLSEIEVGVDISEGNYDILRYYRDEYKDLLAEVKRLRQLNHDLQVEMQKLRDMFGGVEKTVEDVRRLLND